MANGSKEIFLARKFAERMGPLDKQLVEGTAFFEVLFPMITSRGAYDLPKTFFDLRRSARIVGRREGVSPEEAMNMIMVKPAILFEIFDIKPSREWKMQQEGKPTGKENRHKKDPGGLSTSIAANDDFTQASSGHLSQMTGSHPDQAQQLPGVTRKFQQS